MDSVYIEKLGHEVTPKQYILAACPNSVRRVVRVDDDNSEPISWKVSPYQRWIVVPYPGHVDRVLPQHRHRRRDLPVATQPPPAPAPPR